MFFIFIKPMIINHVILNGNSLRIKGKVMIKENSAEGGPDFRIFFYVNNKKYVGYLTYDTRYSINVGDCFWVEYYPKNPNVNRVLIDEPVSCD